MPDQNKPLILIVEDDSSIALGLKLNLERNGFATQTIAHGNQAIEYLKTRQPDLVLLDVMLPGASGFEVCDTVRRTGNRTPILFVTARGQTDDRIRGLELGGDDYITKPFDFDELLTRIRAMLRRQSWYEAPPPSGHVVEFGGNRVDFNAYTARTPRGEVVLTQKENMVLKVLYENEGVVLTRDNILDKVWGYDAYPSSRTIDNLILNLRRYFEEDPKRPKHIQTQYGVGYIFRK